MTRKCVVIGCNTNRRFYEGGLRFFAFPTEDAADARDRWLELIGRDASWTIPLVPCVCQKHFPCSDIPQGRVTKLDESVLPTLNLPEVDGEDEEGGQLRLGDQVLEEQTLFWDVERLSDDEESISIKEIEVDEEVETGLILPQRNPLIKKEKSLLILSDQEERTNLCRLCAATIPTKGGQKVEDLKNQERVADGIWEICLRSFENSLFDKHYPAMCEECWQVLTAFEDFATKCSRKQAKLYKLFETDPVVEVNQEDEQIIEEKPLPAEAESEEDLVDNDLKEESSEETDDEEPEEDIPPLEGLTIAEMIEALEKVPHRTKKREDSCIDQECWDCGKVFSNRWEKKKHRKICTAIGTAKSLRNKTYICEVCERKIRTRSGYRLHLVKMHRDEILEGQLECPEELKKLLARKPLKCPLCVRSFHQVHQLKYHLNTHLHKQLAGLPDVEREVHKTSTCHVCGKTFNQASYLRQHMKFHLKIKDHACDQCDKAFYIKRDLLTHQQSAHLKLKFLCVACGKSYSTKLILDRHIRNVHNKQTDPGSLSCSFCEKRFRTPMELKYHEQTHTGEKNHKCELCGHAFRMRYALTQHKIKIHNIHIEGVKLYKQYRKTNAAKVQDYEESEKEFDKVEYLMQE